MPFGDIFVLRLTDQNKVLRQKITEIRSLGGVVGSASSSCKAAGESVCFRPTAAGQGEGGSRQ